MKKSVTLNTVTSILCSQSPAKFCLTLDFQSENAESRILTTVATPSDPTQEKWIVQIFRGKATDSGELIVGQPEIWRASKFHIHDWGLWWFDMIWCHESMNTFLYRTFQGNFWDVGNGIWMMVDGNIWDSPSERSWISGSLRPYIRPSRKWWSNESRLGW